MKTFLFWEMRNMKRKQELFLRDEDTLLLFSNIFGFFSMNEKWCDMSSDKVSAGDLFNSS